MIVYDESTLYLQPAVLQQVHERYLSWQLERMIRNFVDDGEIVFTLEEKKDLVDRYLAGVLENKAIMSYHTEVAYGSLRVKIVAMSSAEHTIMIPDSFRFDVV